MRLLLSLGAVAIAGAVGYSLGDYYGGEMGVRIEAVAGVLLAAVVMMALSGKRM